MCESSHLLIFLVFLLIWAGSEGIIRAIIEDPQTNQKQLNRASSAIEAMQKDLERIGREIEGLRSDAERIHHEAKDVVDEAKDVVDEAKDVVDEAKDVVDTSLDLSGEQPIVRSTTCNSKCSRLNGDNWEKC